MRFSPSRDTLLNSLSVQSVTQGQCHVLNSASGLSSGTSGTPSVSISLLSLSSSSLIVISSGVGSSSTSSSTSTEWCHGADIVGVACTASFTTLEAAFAVVVVVFAGA